ncbi:VOC family protein [Sphingobium boeckii]|uniref:Catechol 2,3-dioxygenase-like lactoylglutathione lyase family enzyme n=1 Tax=Sphingobium boeckii TaxID=1082345 RepID=A0A7W9EF69_9SPHN|nr:VOC family protein [Sphingobium boeckii]MBB5686764.1 catechol 2,3-dioxygenase-like lactoylglutathione lyase family enzyme [Sphingobium boeckii]
MISTARFGTRDIERAKIFYDGIAHLLGAVRAFDRPDLVAYKAGDGGMLLIGTPFAGEASAGNGNQVGMIAPSRDVVDAVHAKALELGGADEGAPGIRGDDANGFYGAYFRDPDGNKLAVFRFGPP